MFLRSYQYLVLLFLLAQRRFTSPSLPSDSVCGLLSIELQLLLPRLSGPSVTTCYTRTSLVLTRSPPTASSRFPSTFNFISAYGYPPLADVSSRQPSCPPTSSSFRIAHRKLLTSALIYFFWSSKYLAMPTFLCCGSSLVVCVSVATRGGGLFKGLILEGPRRITKIFHFISSSAAFAEGGFIVWGFIVWMNPGEVTEVPLFQLLLFYLPSTNIYNLRIRTIQSTPLSIWYYSNFPRQNKGM